MVPDKEYLIVVKFKTQFLFLIKYWTFNF